jgi:hypothetical protein
MKKFFRDAGEDFVKTLKEKTWVGLYVVVILALFLATVLWSIGHFDVNLGITLAVVEIPLALFGAIIINTILRESRKQAKEIGEEVGKQIGKLPIIDQKRTENKKHIDEHCKVLIDRFRERSARAMFANVFTEFDLYNHLPDKEQLLQHFYTGHEELLYFLKQSTDFEKEQQSIPKPISKENQQKWSEINSKYNEVHSLYKKKIDELLGQIDRKSSQLGGICNECKKWYDPQDENFKQLATKLNSFTMPF